MGCGIAGALGALVSWLLHDLWVGVLPLGLLLEAAIASSLLAYRGLFEHVAAVRDALAVDLESGRRAVARIVGRDVDALDEAGVTRAALESAAENFSDGFLAPLFWLALGGLPGLAVYKAANTFDSVIGHRSERYLYFGRAAARFDDLLNYVPARLSVLVFASAAALLPGCSGRRALRAAWRDAASHRSPNAGWPEAALAGALDVALGGARSYAGESVGASWLHAGGDRRPTRAAISGALRLYLGAGGATLALGSAAVLLVAASSSG